MNAKLASCAICSKPLAPDSATIDDRGLPVHEKCYALVLKVRGVRRDSRGAVRCPYCAEDGNFKLMKARADGEWFLCPTCGHAAMPSNSSYHCNCSKCIELS